MVSIDSYTDSLPVSIKREKRLTAHCMSSVYLIHKQTCLYPFVILGGVMCYTSFFASNHNRICLLPALQSKIWYTCPQHPQLVTCCGQLYSFYRCCDLNKLRQHALTPPHGCVQATGCYNTSCPFISMKISHIPRKWFVRLPQTFTFLDPESIFSLESLSG